ncbi:MAG TPA: hypothetical protein DIW17_12590 [Clostridiales bacterium]|jgi:hypothetical protein|nr:hypothetical protein [Clostridiales bacterium]
MKKSLIIRCILESNDLDFTTKRVWYYLATNYPIAVNQHQIDLFAWKIAENLEIICSELNMSENIFFQHLGRLKQFCNERKTFIPLGLNRPIKGAGI